MPDSKAQPNAPQGLYAPRFTPRERAILAALVDVHSLGAEIALLRVLIHRHLTRPPSEQSRDGGATPRNDVETIKPYFDILFRAIKVSLLATDRARQESDPELQRIIDEVALELGQGLFSPPPDPTPGQPPPAAGHRPTWGGATLLTFNLGRLSSSFKKSDISYVRFAPFAVKMDPRRSQIWQPNVRPNCGIKSLTPILIALRSLRSSR